MVSLSAGILLPIAESPPLAVGHAGVPAVHHRVCSDVCALCGQYYRQPFPARASSSCVTCIRGYRHHLWPVRARHALYADKTAMQATVECICNICPAPGAAKCQHSQRRAVELVWEKTTGWRENIICSENNEAHCTGVNSKYGCHSLDTEHCEHDPTQWVAASTVKTYSYAQCTLIISGR